MYRILISLTAAAGFFAPAAQAFEPNCRDYFSSHYPAENFQFLEQGLALDKKNNVLWFRCNAGEFWHQGACRGEARPMTWSDAMDFAAQAELAGRSNWRLPTRSELRSLVVKQCVNPSINPYVFPTVQSNVYWTSKENFFNPFMAWGVFFYSGNDFSRHYKEYEFLALLVHDL